MLDLQTQKSFVDRVWRLICYGKDGRYRAHSDRLTSSKRQVAQRMKKTTPSKAVKPVLPAAKKTSLKGTTKAVTAKVVAAAKKVVAAPVARKTTAAPVVTVITASIDIGFGHILFIRGEGPGLSWDKGLPMTCIADDQWRISLGETSKPIVFKFLVDDLSWSTGSDFVAAPGSAILVEPTF